VYGVHPFSGEQYDMYGKGIQHPGYFGHPGYLGSGYPGNLGYGHPGYFGYGHPSSYGQFPYGGQSGYQPHYGSEWTSVPLSKGYSSDWTPMSHREYDWYHFPKGERFDRDMGDKYSRVRGMEMEMGGMGMERMGGMGYKEKDRMGGMGYKEKDRMGGMGYKEKDQMEGQGSNWKNVGTRGTDLSYYEGWWKPRADILEFDNQVRVEFELPGVTKEHVALKAQGDALVLTSTKPITGKHDKSFYYQNETLWQFLPQINSSSWCGMQQSECSVGEWYIKGYLAQNHGIQWNDRREHNQY